MWSYYRLLHLPLGLMIAAVVMPAAVFAFAISLFRSFLGRGRPILAVLAFPATIVSYEYPLQPLAGHLRQHRLHPAPRSSRPPTRRAHRHLGHLRPGRHSSPPRPSLCSTSAAPSAAPLAAALAVVLVAVLGYGFARLANTPPAPSTVRVGFAENHVGPNMYVPARPGPS